MNGLKLQEKLLRCLACGRYRNQDEIYVTRCLAGDCELLPPPDPRLLRRILALEAEVKRLSQHPAANYRQPGVNGHPLAVVPTFQREMSNG